MSNTKLVLVVRQFIITNHLIATLPEQFVFSMNMSMDVNMSMSMGYEYVYECQYEYEYKLWVMSYELWVWVRVYTYVYPSVPAVIAECSERRGDDFGAGVWVSEESVRLRSEEE